LLKKQPQKQEQNGAPKKKKRKIPGPKGHNLLQKNIPPENGPTRQNGGKNFGPIERVGKSKLRPKGKGKKRTKKTSTFCVFLNRNRKKPARKKPPGVSPRVVLEQKKGGSKRKDPLEVRGFGVPILQGQNWGPYSPNVVVGPGVGVSGIHHIGGRGKNLKEEVLEGVVGESLPIRQKKTLVLQT